MSKFTDPNERMAHARKVWEITPRPRWRCFKLNEEELQAVRATYGKPVEMRHMGLKENKRLIKRELKK